MAFYKIDKIVIIIQSVKYDTLHHKKHYIVREIHLIQMHILIFRTFKKRNKK